MKKILLYFIFALLLAGTADAQRGREYGKPWDMEDSPSPKREKQTLGDVVWFIVSIPVGIIVIAGIGVLCEKYNK